MAVKFFDLKNPYGVVKTKGIEIVDFEEKPVQKSTIINAGVYVISPKTIKIKPNFFSYSAVGYRDPVNHKVSAI